MHAFIHVPPESRAAPKSSKTASQMEEEAGGSILDILFTNYSFPNASLFLMSNILAAPCFKIPHKVRGVDRFSFFKASRVNESHGQFPS